jgi:hypothetical protein
LKIRSGRTSKNFFSHRPSFTPNDRTGLGQPLCLAAKAGTFLNDFFHEARFFRAYLGRAKIRFAPSGNLMGSFFSETAAGMCALWPPPSFDRGARRNKRAAKTGCGPCVDMRHRNGKLSPVMAAPVQWRVNKFTSAAQLPAATKWQSGRSARDARLKIQHKEKLYAVEQ